MKNWTWKEWTVLALVLADLVTEVVLVFVAPQIALLDACIIGFAFIVGLADLLESKLFIKKDKDKMTD